MNGDELVAEARRRGVAQRSAQGLPPLIVDPVIGRLASEALASASSTDSDLSAVVVESVEHGAAGSSPHATGVRPGRRTPTAAREGQPTGSRSSARRPNTKTAGAATPTALTTAG